MTEGAFKRASFERQILPHLDAAHNLARWLLRNQTDAEDAVQEAFLRAFAFFEGFRGDDARAWLLAIVRNSCFTWLRKQKAQPPETPFEEQIHAGEEPNPEEIQIEKAGREVLEQEIGKLSAEYREVLVLREMEGLSYRQIASITGVPVGTVMSRLARSRRKLAEGLVAGRGTKT